VHESSNISRSSSSTNETKSDFSKGAKLPVDDRSQISRSKASVDWRSSSSSTIGTKNDWPRTAKVTIDESSPIYRSKSCADRRPQLSGPSNSNGIGRAHTTRPTKMYERNKTNTSTFKKYTKPKS
jgi:hypothetical protein